MERLRLISSRTAGFGKIVNRLAFHAANILARPEPPGPALMKRSPGAGMFLTRSHYSLLFMPFSPTVWLLPEHPAYLIAPVGRDRGTYLDYKEAVKEYGQAEVQKTLKLDSDNYRRELAGEPGRAVPE